jgi:hypothetical protein
MSWNSIESGRLPYYNTVVIVLTDDYDITFYKRRMGVEKDYWERTRDYKVVNPPIKWRYYEQI